MQATVVDVEAEPVRKTYDTDTGVLSDTKTEIIAPANGQSGGGMFGGMMGPSPFATTNNGTVQPTEPPKPAGSPTRDGGLRNNLETIQRALDKTVEVLQDPDLIMNERKLPKAGNDPMPFETEQYSANV